ncbi:MAG TPA: Calx-beta domain-containing protein [Vicinamibacteria bacterium]
MSAASFVGWHLVALALSGAPDSSLPPRYPCEGNLLTAAEIAAHRGITLQTLEELGKKRSLPPAALCEVSEATLQRAIYRLEAPDLPDEAMRHRLLDLVDENGKIAHDALMKANAVAASMKRQSAREGQNAGGISPGAWTWLGPGNIGGRVRGLLIHPTATSTMWAAGVAGGIWKTTNCGPPAFTCTWAPLDDFMANLAVTHLVLDPNNSNIIYAATGEGFFNADAIRGAGIFRSPDGGTTWARLASTNVPDFYFTNRLSFSQDGLVMLAATNTGIFRSTDAGANWTLVHTPPSGVRMMDVNFHPTDNLKAIAGRSDGNPFYSTDGGVTWNAGAHPPFTPGSTPPRLEVAYAPSNPAITYASLNVNGGELWRSTDGGQNYTLVNTGLSYLGTQGWYDNLLWVDPTNPDIVLVGGIDIWRSTNGGANFTQISQWFSAPNSAHADHHTAVAHPNFDGVTNTTVFFGNDGGIYRATNVYTVALTTGWQELNNNLGITQFYGAGGFPGTGTIVGGTQDNGTLRYRTSTGTEGWTTMFGGDGGWSASDQTDSNYFYGEYVYLRIHRSTNAGASSSYIYSGIADAASSCANFISPFVIDPQEPNRMLGGACSLWRSDNVKAATPTWTAIKAPITGNQRISAVVVAQGNSDLVFVGYNNGDVYKTLNGTAASPIWTLVDTGLPNRRVTRITIDPADHNSVYATFAGFSPDNVWYSNNQGTSWVDRTGSGGTGLPDAPVRSLVLHPGRASWIYAGTEVGVFVSEDGGLNWSLPHDGPANVSVDELFWMGTTLVAVTHGRGMFSAPAPLGQAVTLTVVGASANVAEPAGPATVTVRLVTSDGLPTTNPASVSYATGGGSATSGSDYTSTSGTLNFPAATASGTTMTVNVPITNDTAAEPSETFNFSLSSPSGASLGSPNTQVVTILDDDTAPTLTAASINVTEGNAGTTNATFTLTLGQALGRTVAINFTTADGTARAPGDYTTTSGSVTFPVGALTQTVTVPVVGDTINEGDESFSLNMTGDATATATATIVNDDTGPRATGYYPLNACRVLDTRTPVGPSGGPAISDSVVRTFPVGGLCSVPLDAIAVALNLTETAATGAGHCTVYPAGGILPTASVINFVPTRARANNLIVPLGTGGQLNIRCVVTGPGIVHAIVDVSGYFR